MPLDDPRHRGQAAVQSKSLGTGHGRCSHVVRNTKRLDEVLQLINNFLAAHPYTSKLPDFAERPGLFSSRVIMDAISAIPGLPLLGNTMDLRRVPLTSRST